jgi:hypothetical protein
MPIVGQHRPNEDYTEGSVLVDTDPEAIACGNDVQSTRALDASTTEPEWTPLVFEIP